MLYNLIPLSLPTPSVFPNRRLHFPDTTSERVSLTPVDRRGSASGEHRHPATPRYAILRHWGHGLPSASRYKVQTKQPSENH